VWLPYRDVEDLAARYDFADLQSFLDLYYANMATLRTAQDFADMTEAYLARAAAAGVVHAEVFLDPQAHTARGVPRHDHPIGMSRFLTLRSESEDTDYRELRRSVSLRPRRRPRPG